MSSVTITMQNNWANITISNGRPLGQYPANYLKERFNVTEIDPFALKDAVEGVLGMPGHTEFSGAKICELALTKLYG